jgi:hypothetical protein
MIKSKNTVISTNTFQKSINNMFLGEVSIDGELKKIKGDFIQWYVQTHIAGIYRVVHNLNRLDYAVSAGRTTNDLVAIEVSNLTDISFDVKITKDGEVMQLPFRFSLNFMVE